MLSHIPKSPQANEKEQVVFEHFCAQPRGTRDVVGPLNPVPMDQAILAGQSTATVQDELRELIDTRGVSHRSQLSNRN